MDISDFPRSDCILFLSDDDASFSIVFNSTKLCEHMAGERTREAHLLLVCVLPGLLDGFYVKDVKDVSRMYWANQYTFVHITRLK